MNLNKRKQGKQYEQIAAKFLQSKGYQILATNYQAGKYELDLVALDQEILVFVEVKYRGHHQIDHYNPFESIPASKQKRIFRAAQSYLQKHLQYNHLFSRFDGIFILSHSNFSQEKIIHLQNIFWAS